MGYCPPLPPFSSVAGECAGCGAPLDSARCDYCGRGARRESDKPPRDIAGYSVGGRLPIMPTPQGEVECGPGRVERFVDAVLRGKAKRVNLWGRADCRDVRPPAGNDVELK